MAKSDVRGVGEGRDAANGRETRQHSMKRVVYVIHTPHVFIHPRGQSVKPLNSQYCKANRSIHVCIALYV